jgi:quercetin dioxygenase-like cupin family protein
MATQLEQPTEAATRVVHGEDVPWVWMGFENSGVEMKFLKRGRQDNVCTFMNRFAPGFMAPRHLHLGEVHAWTMQGRWRYLEYDWEALAGDYVYEPPDTIHTLYIPEDNKELTVVLFTVAKGMDLYDENDEVFMTQDGAGLEELYRAGLAEQGLDWPEAILP